MLLQDILREKGREVHTITPYATLADVVDRLVHHNIGSLIVNDGVQMVGIITERDILRACAARKVTLEELTVGEHMTKPVVTGRPDQTVNEVMGLLTEKRIRHLPVIEGDKLLGMISIGDVVKAQHVALSVENHYLKEYLQG